MSIHHRSGKAWRRHDSKRIKEKVSGYLSLRYVKNSGLYSSEEFTKIVGCRSKKRADCSCFMCGNPRRKFGYKTLAELKKDSDWSSQWY